MRIRNGKLVNPERRYKGLEWNRLGLPWREVNRVGSMEFRISAAVIGPKSGVQSVFNRLTMLGKYEN